MVSSPDTPQRRSAETVIEPSGNANRAASFKRSGEVGVIVGVGSNLATVADPSLRFAFFSARSIFDSQILVPFVAISAS